MNRYGTGRDDPDHEPGSERQVLRNQLGIIVPAEAARMESELLARAYTGALQQLIGSLQFDAAIIRKMHRSWLGSLYFMAGEYRQVDLSKGGFTFCHAL